ncbi:MAG: hypothetical protein K2O34_03120, partial [Acetatifactor sp.]|nr:hypothetical protein [Acetatifactor sp.]
INTILGQMVTCCLLLAGCGQPDADSNAVESSAGQLGERVTEITESSESQSEEGTLELSADDVEELSADWPKGSAAEQSESEAEQTASEPEKYIVPTLPDTGQELSDFVAEGWELLDSVELDFNKDGIMDYVGVQEVPPDKEQEEWRYPPSPRILFAIVSDGPGQYRLDFRDENLIRTIDEGGTFGDPYEPLTAEGTSFTTHAYGGNAWKLSEEYTYTYRDENWYLTRLEYFYSYLGPYITEYVLYDWEKGVHTRMKRSEETDDIERIWAEYDNLEDYTEYDLEYEMKLDEPFTLYQVSKRWPMAQDRLIDRVTDWEVREIVLEEGIELSPEMIRMPEKAYPILYRNEDCMLYTFSNTEQDDPECYLAIYRWQDKSLTVLIAGDGKSGMGNCEIYRDKIYYSTAVIKHIAYRSVEDGETSIKEGDRLIGRRLNRMNLDGTEEETIFEYLYPGTDQQLLPAPPPYMGLMTDISGGEIVVEVYIHNDGEPHPVYRMDVDGSNLRQIGQIPKE